MQPQKNSFSAPISLYILFIPSFFGTAIAGIMYLVADVRNPYDPIILISALVQLAFVVLMFFGKKIGLIGISAFLIYLLAVIFIYYGYKGMLLSAALPTSLALVPVILLIAEIWIRHRSKFS